MFANIFVQSNVFCSCNIKFPEDHFQTSCKGSCKTKKIQKTFISIKYLLFSQFCRTYEHLSPRLTCFKVEFKNRKIYFYFYFSGKSNGNKTVKIFPVTSNPIMGPMHIFNKEKYKRRPH